MDRYQRATLVAVISIAFLIAAFFFTRWHSSASGLATFIGTVVVVGLSVMGWAVLDARRSR